MMVKAREATTGFEPVIAVLQMGVNVCADTRGGTC